MNLKTLTVNTCKALINKAKPKPLSPQLLLLETTRHCNSHCSTCEIWRNKKPEYDLKLESLKTFYSPHKLKDALLSSLFRNVKYIINSGGEPTLLGVKNLSVLLWLEHECIPKATLQISSNGILAEVLYNVVRSRLPMSTMKIDVGLSLDGIGDAHDFIRGVKGNFQSVNLLLQKLRILRKQYPEQLRVSVGSTLTDNTAKQTDELLGYAKRFKVSFMWHWLNKTPYYKNEDFPKQNAECYEEAIRKVFPDSLYRKMWLDSLKGISPKFKCYALQTFALIKRNGDVVPCLNLYDENVGNIYESNPMEIWHSKKAEQVRSKIANCPGCLNNWGVNWSLGTSYFPLLKYGLRKRLRHD